MPLWSWTIYQSRSESSEKLLVRKRVLHLSKRSLLPISSLLAFSEVGPLAMPWLARLMKSTVTLRKNKTKFR